MRIRLKTLTIRNFKGIKELSLNFNDTLTSIFGNNATGKTTIMDAFIWLFFSKDSQDRKEFDIKNTKYPELNRQEHEVSASLDKDGQSIEIKHVYKEKWTKKKGAQFPEMTRHEHLFFWNDVPFPQAEFKAKIETTLLSEDLFRLLTNAHCFTSLPWKKQRGFLIDMAGGLSDAQIAAGNSEFESLLAQLSNKTLDEYKREIGTKKKKIKDELELIPARIDEVQRNTPEPQDFAAIEASLKEQQGKLSSVETSISNESEAYRKKFQDVQNQQNEIHKLKTRQNDVRYRIQGEQQRAKDERRLKKDRLNDQIKDLKQSLQSKSTLLSSRKQTKSDLQIRVDNLRELWATTNDKEIEFNQHEFSCPTCLRAFEPGDIDAKKAELTVNFNEEKARSLEDIVKKANHMKIEVQECDDMVASLENAIKKIEEDLFIAGQDLQNWEVNNAPVVDKSLEDLLKQDDEYLKLERQIISQTQAIKEVTPIDLTELNQQKALIIAGIDDLKKQLITKVQIERSERRVDELKADENKLSQELADLEGTEFLIDSFTRFKLDSIEQTINGMFSYVSFKLFDRQINGGEVETCEVMHDGVPYSVLNNAARINAGLDIIRTLSRHYGVSAPIFVDNAESVTELLPMDSQLIRLVVSEINISLTVK